MDVSDYNLAGARSWSGALVRLCGWLASLALVVMVLLVLLEIATRNLLQFSFQITDEFCGYALVAATFLSMPVALAHSSFHSLTVFSAKMTGRRATAWRAMLLLVSVLFLLPLLWQLIRLTWRSYHSGNVAMTHVQTPLWLPQALMPVGMALLILIAALIAVRDMRRLASGFNGASDLREPK